MALKIYLADLVYDTVVTNYVVPLNVAYVAAYTKEKFGADVDIEIFKSPRELEKRIKDSPPDILGLSNYSWNERLSHLFLNMVKRLKPEVITVMGGPNIRTDSAGIEAYLSANNLLDYYILFEGEEPFANLVEQSLVRGGWSKSPVGCARLIEGRLHFEPVDLKNKAKQIDYPSAYLSGFLDDFLIDSNMTPLLETTRGCPFGCTYCTWGIAALSKVRCRSLEMIYAELDYVAEKSAKQVNWIFCDANFGILKRDLEIAKKIRCITDEYGYPIDVTLWHSKNTGERNIEIVKIIKGGEGYIAIQSTDPIVLGACGRGNIQFKHILTQIDFYKKNGMEVSTDILIGLPNETAESHLNSLIGAFDLGFTKIAPINIRMLPGSQYETEDHRKTYGVQTKFRPIFGAYGTYNGQNVCEIEESVRATKDMTELELENFKILHWLIYFCWNMGFCKPLLLFAKEQGINPCMALHRLTSTDHPLLAGVFSRMKQQSMNEWHKTKADAVAFYQQQEHFDEMVHNFVKLNSLWIATVFQDSAIVSTLSGELARIIKSDPRVAAFDVHGMLEELINVTNRIVCTDLLQDEFIYCDTIDGKILSYVLNDPDLSNIGAVDFEIYRSKDVVAYCNYHLNNNNQRDFSIQNLTRFLETTRGASVLRNEVSLVTIPYN